MRVLKISRKICYLSIGVVLFSLTAQAQQPKASNDAKTIPELSNIDAYFQNHEPSKVPLSYETEEEYNTRMQWWKDAKYGMFIHWGLYSILAGEYKGEITPQIAEWIQNTLKIPLSEYKKLQKKFNPKQFDADAWALMAKNAGMKYIVLTSKHHDGFALFNSKASDYNSVHTPFKRDIVKELKEACHRKGLKFGLYYSHTIDWENPYAYVGEGKLRNRMNTLDFDPKKEDRALYLIEKAYPQLKEILTNYGKIDILWFDMGGGLSNDEVREFVKITRELQPHIIISSRVGSETDQFLANREMLFDFYTPNDNFFTGDDLPMPWEMAGTTNGSWGFRKDDQEWRRPEFIINSLFACASRNGNYLLNVGPKANGIIPEEPVKNMLVVGNWLKKNGESLYGTSGSPFPWNHDWGYITKKPHKLYLNVMHWPKNKVLELNGLLSKVSRVSMLPDTKNLKYKQEGRFLTIDLKGLKENHLATTIVVHYEDDIIKIAPVISQDRTKNTQLDRISGSYDEKNKISTWKFKVHTPGKFMIKVVSYEKGRHSDPQWIGSDQEGSITIAGQIIPLKLNRDYETPSPSLFFYKNITSNAGAVEILKKGTYTLQLKGFQIGAQKYEEGLGLNYITLIQNQ